MSTSQPDSKIKWNKNRVSDPRMSYESISPLYFDSKPNTFGDRMGFILSCSNQTTEIPGCQACIQKLDVIAIPCLSQAEMKISHEIVPNLGACSQIVPVNSLLKVSSFDNGVIVPVKNFGFSKTFNCEVKSKLQHHTAPINCLAVNKEGTQIASGTSNGEIAIYEVDRDEIFFLTRSKLTNACITGLAYLKPEKDICCRPEDREVLQKDHMLIYSTQDGCIGLIDTRCGIGGQLDHCIAHTTQPRLNITSLCLINSVYPGQRVVLGTLHGQLASIDLRHINAVIYHEISPQDERCIKRIKEVVITCDNGSEKTFIAYTNSTKEIKVIDAKTMEPSTEWKCDRQSEGIINDFCVVGDRIVTCGKETSIGCWIWDHSS